MTYPPQQPQDPQAAQQQAAQQQAWAQQQQQAAQQQAWAQQQAQQQAAQQQAWAQQQAQAAPAQPRPNPFAGTPISDWVRDGAAAVLLLVSLALPLTMSTTGKVVVAGRVEVLLITILSVMSIAVGYLAKFGVFGPRMTPNKVAMLRAVVNVPYVLVALLYIVLGAIPSVHYAYGVGFGLGVGLAGALLAAIPRKQEAFTAEFAPTAAKYAYNTLLGYFGFVVLATLAGVILTLITLFKSFNSYGDAGITTLSVISTLLVQLLPSLAVVALFFLVVRRSGTTRILALGVSYAALLALFIGSFSKGGTYENLDGSYGMPVILLGAAIGILGSPALAYAMQGSDQQAKLWQDSTRIAPIAIMITGALATVTAVLAIIVHSMQDSSVSSAISDELDDYGMSLDLLDSLGIDINDYAVPDTSYFGYSGGIGLVIGVLICVLLITAAAALLRMQIVSNYAQGRMIIAAIAGGIAVAGLVAIILRAIDKSGAALLELDESWMIIGFFGSVGMLLYALFSPKEVRDYFKNLQPQMPAQAQYPTGAYPAGGFPGVQQGQAPGAPAVPAPAAPAVPLPGSAAPAVPAPAAPAVPMPGSAAPAVPVPAAPAVPAPGSAAPAVPAPGSAAPAVPMPGSAAPAVPAPAAPAVPAPGSAAPAADAPATPVAAEPAPAEASAPAEAEAEAPQVDPELLQRAADPQTSAQDLFELAKNRDLWAALATNPALYPDLANWLAKNGGPEIAESLRANGKIQ